MAKTPRYLWGVTKADCFQFIPSESPSPKAGRMYFDETQNLFKFCEDGIHFQFLPDFHSSSSLSSSSKSSSSLSSSSSSSKSSSSSSSSRSSSSSSRSSSSSSKSSTSSSSSSSA